SSSSGATSREDKSEMEDKLLVEAQVAVLAGLVAVAAVQVKMYRKY
ncbi:15473_t:CDS:2, partial [Racocetra fulgida]